MADATQATEHPMARVLIAIPNDDFDPTESAVPWKYLRTAGHDVEMLPAFTATMGHAGALVRHPSGVIEGATDPRSDGAAVGW